MPDTGRETMEMVIGAMMAQSAVLEFMVKAGVIERGPLLEHLAEKLVSWEKTATPNALFPVNLLVSILAGRQLPPPPSTLN